MLKYKNKKTDSELFNLSQAQLNKLRNIDTYRKNEVQINVIKEILINHCDVSESILNTLISSVSENAKIECKKI